MNIITMLKMFSNEVGHALFVNQNQLIYLWLFYLVLRLFIYLRRNYKDRKLYADLAPVVLAVTLFIYEFTKYYYIQNMGQLGPFLNNITLIARVLLLGMLLVYVLYRWMKYGEDYRMYELRTPRQNRETHRRKKFALVVEVAMVTLLLFFIYLVY